MGHRGASTLKHVKPRWLLDALAVLRPPEPLTVSEWADRNIILDQSSAQPGQWQTSLTPYLRGIMDAFADPEVEELWFCKPTQVGGSAAILNMLGYIIAQDPSPTMIVYPTEHFAKDFSKSRIQPMIQLSPVLKSKYRERDSTDTELHFSDMILYLAWANSATSLAGRPIRYLFFDEPSKYPKHVGDEPSPFKLAIERTNTFPHNRKVVGASTPLLTDCKIWQVKDQANEVLYYHVACPHCGFRQPLRFRPFVRWPEGADADHARERAWYECERCQGRITDADKAAMNAAGKWLPVEKRGVGRRCVWFGLSSIYSPWKRFGDIAHEFLSTRDDPTELQNFVNSWLGEAWEQRAIRLDQSLVFERQTDLEVGTVPRDTLCLTGGVDVQESGFYWTIRAWGAGRTSWNVAHGFSLDWSTVETVMNREWSGPDGKTQVNLCCIDSGNNADEVYEFCAINSDWTVPVKGASSRLLSRYRVSVINRPNNRADGMPLVLIDTQQYKSMIAARLRKPNGRGSWMVHKDVDSDYAAQLTAEHQVQRKVNGVVTWWWTPKSEREPNHYLDSEVYAACAADLLNIEFFESPQIDDNTPADKPAPQGDVGMLGLQPGSWMQRK
jgi:phage terminase large subunit GpA-like protein